MAFSDNEHLFLVRLDRWNVLCLKAFRPFRDIELYSVAFLQAAEAACLDSRRTSSPFWRLMKP